MIPSRLRRPAIAGISQTEAPRSLPTGQTPSLGMETREGAGL